jgi:hypothetical protein
MKLLGSLEIVTAKQDNQSIPIINNPSDVMMLVLYSLRMCFEFSKIDSNFNLCMHGLTPSFPAMQTTY